MKKTLITVGIVLFFTAFFIAIFHFTSGASDVSIEDTTEASIESTEREEVNDERALKKEEIKSYIKEKIVPVVVGVLTSASALLATLAAIKRSLSSIGETKEAFKKESKSREESFKKESEYLSKKAEELEKMASLVPKLQEEILVLEKNTQSLICECANLGKMISLGFSQDERVISSGNGKKINKLLKSCQLISSRESDKDPEAEQEEAFI